VRRKTSPRPVILIWDDASSGGTADSIGLDKTKYVSEIYHTVAWLVKKEKEGYVLATDYHPKDKEIRGPHYIPKGMIKELIYLRSESEDT
jgi:hypothetical protein